jgi:hypothetical protein
MVLIFAGVALFAAEPLYRSAAVDEQGQLHIVFDTGKEVMPRKADGQVSFGDPRITPDRRTVGWLVMYPYPSLTGDYRPGPIPGKLVIFRAGHVIHTFTTEQVFLGLAISRGRQTDCLVNRTCSWRRS